ncbi:MAG TPA: metallophosphoesterase [Candidatus Sulfotelmatobacter sp.]|nr:metallophosphoesterase [Candidatus Sulfotelmatobacter sp.]
MRPWKRIFTFVFLVQCILLLTHFFLYETWIFSPGTVDPPPSTVLKLSFAVLSFSFVAASLFAFRYNNSPIRLFYTAAAVWLGFVNFFFVAAVFAWAAWVFFRIAGLPMNFHRTVEGFFVMACLAASYAVWNANRTRVVRATVRLPKLPASWRGRTAALVSDLHLGHVHNGRFLKRIVAKIMNERPDVVFIPGDLYDGTSIDASAAASPLAQLRATHGVYFVAGNHEQFGDDTRYLRAIEEAGVRVLRNEKVDLDGLQVVGVPFRDAAHGSSFASNLNRASIDQTRASILLTHAPDNPAIAEAAGFSLQLSGHTHLGQFFPWTWFVRRIYRQFAYGWSRIGNMQVFTSSGAGTWGPPLRMGSNPEIVILRFE